ncbi:MAG: hypothetical protein R3F59_24110 [Myxococcota bacterium]
MLFAVVSAAFAAPSADLVVTVHAPASQLVYDEDTWTVTVDNTGNRDASDVVVAIALPPTHTSPVVEVMGLLGATSPGCTLSGTVLSCALGRVRRGQGASASFDVAWPVSRVPLVVTATGSTSSPEVDLSDNTDGATAAVTYEAVAVVPAAPYTVRSCTGTDLTGFYECVLNPSSITSHTGVMDVGGGLTLPVAGYSGSWWQPGPDALVLQYVTGGAVAATFTGSGVAADCFEGTTALGSGWTAAWEVCL